MYVYRYMSQVELGLYQQGVTIVGKDHSRKHRSASNGVCFLAESTEVEDVGEFAPEQCLMFLTSVVTNKNSGFGGDHLLVCFEMADELLTESVGRYAHPYNYDTILITEFTAASYNRDTAVLRGYAVLADDDADCYHREPSVNWYLG